jgi:hypothetical protein
MVVAALGLAVVLGGCKQTDAVQAAATIHAYLPTVVALAQDAGTLVAGLEPAEAAEVSQVSAKVQAELAVLEQVSGAYAAAPSAEGWARLGAVVDQLVSDADTGLMAALAIKSEASQTKAKAALSALDAAVHVVEGYLASARGPVAAQAAVEKRPVRLAAVVRQWSASDWRRVETGLGVSREAVMAAGEQSHPIAAMEPRREGGAPVNGGAGGENRRSLDSAPKGGALRSI